MAKSLIRHKKSTYIVFQGQRTFTSGDIELNPGSADANILPDSRLAQQSLSILHVDVGCAGDWFFLE